MGILSKDFQPPLPSGVKISLPPSGVSFMA